jgi:putative Mg2+ transporter-C (MgtC) family protein
MEDPMNETMPLNPTWEDIALRLILTLIAGALIGFNREAHGQAAGLRTTILVCLAASVAMILANMMLTLEGKTESSFVRTDVMRLPLGVLTGVGFIGGGAILRRDGLIAGVTTAATLWLVTVIGLCFGAGDVWLGVAATAISLVVLWAFKWIDDLTPRTQRALLILTADGAIPVEQVRDLASSSGCIVRLREQRSAAEGTITSFDVFWSGRPNSDPPMGVVEKLGRRSEVRSVEWKSEAPY